MMALALLATTAAVDGGSVTFRVGAWEGRCSRMKKAQCMEYEAVISGPAGLRFKRDSSTISIIVTPEGCKSRPWSGSINPAYSARTMTHMIRGHVVMALASCKTKLPIPELLADDTTELLRQTEIVKN